MEAKKAKVVDSIRCLNLEEKVWSVMEKEVALRDNTEVFEQIAKFEEIT